MLFSPCAKIAAVASCLLFAQVHAQPTVVRAIQGNGIVTLVWKRVSGASTYNIYRSTTSGNTGTTPLVGSYAAFSNSTTPGTDAAFYADYADKSVTNGTTYYYQISVGSGAKSVQVQATPGAASHAISKSRFLKILPLGNSLTSGWSGDAGPNSLGGYRLPLINLLTNGGYNFLLVGSYTLQSGSMADPYHEGWNNRKISDITYGVADRAIPNYAPDLVILEIGTNDFVNTEVDISQKDPARFLLAYDSLVDKIYGYLPNVSLLMVPIPEWCFSQNAQEVATISARVVTYNAGLKTLSQQYAQQGRNVAYIAEAENVKTNYSVGGDCLHPPEASYTDIAGMLYTAIQGMAATGASVAAGSRDGGDGRGVRIEARAGMVAVAGSGSESAAVNVFTPEGRRVACMPVARRTVDAAAPAPGAYVVEVSLRGKLARRTVVAVR